MDKKGIPQKLHNLRHSLAHILASAVTEMFPAAQLGVGPVIENGFYYDFLLPRSLTPEDLKKIEKRMRVLVKEKLTFERSEMDTGEAKAYFAERKQPFKIQLIEDIEKFGTTKADEILNAESEMKAEEKKVNKQEKVTLYKTGKFTDLCRGGHVGNTSEIDTGSFMLSRVSGAYWRGDQANPQMQRVYGLAFETKQALEDYLKYLEEVEKRDHKKLGPQLELFMFHPTSPGMPYWLPKGVVLYNELINFWRMEHRKRGYQEIVSPLLNKKELYVTSGHFDHYWENMFVSKTAEDEEYGVKAMNCPNAHVVFGSKQHSYRDLPLRLSDTDTLHRFELSGTLNGLLRVREFRQDDAHIYVAEEQIESEYVEVFKIVELFYSVFGMNYSYRLGTRPEEFMGDKETWNRAEATLKRILEKSGKDYFVLEGDGAFYGPKVDILMKDALGRDWQMGTVQLDFQQPRRFNLEYTAADGSKKTPVAIHRVVYGSLERFIGILIEHYAGAFPLWISPVQAAVLPVSDKFNDYARMIVEELEASNIRAHIDDRSESVGRKIREAEMQKIPYMLVVGEKEKESGKVCVRKRGEKEQASMALQDLAGALRDEIADKR